MPSGNAEQLIQFTHGDKQACVKTSCHKIRRICVWFSRTTLWFCREVAGLSEKWLLRRRDKIKCVILLKQKNLSSIYCLCLFKNLKNKFLLRLILLLDLWITFHFKETSSNLKSYSLVAQFLKIKW